MSFEGSTSFSDTILDDDISFKDDEEDDHSHNGDNGIDHDEMAIEDASFEYDHAKVRELAAHMVLAHEHSFDLMEGIMFNKLMRTISPFWEEISQHTIRNDCFSIYEIEKKKLKILLKDVNKVSVTTDLWKTYGKDTIDYMVVTCHFIDADWKLQKRVIHFCDIPHPRSGVVISDALTNCLDEWGLLNKLCSVTVDNSSYNDAAIEVLKPDSALRGNLFFGGKFFEVRCCAHILNILAQYGLEQIMDIVECIREAVRYLTYSEAHLRKFNEIAKQLLVPSEKLILDWPTRWDGTYLMLASALEFKEVFLRYQEQDPMFSYVPSSDDWIKVDQVCRFLGKFSEVAKIMSRTDYPTPNSFLVEMWRIKRILNAKMNDGSDFLKSMALAMNEKYEKYWRECNLLISIAAVLDPRFKMRLLEFCFPKIYPTIEAERNIQMVRDTLYELYGNYVSSYISSEQERSMHKQSSCISSQSDESGSIDVLSDKASFESFVRKENEKMVKLELDKYLEEGLYMSEGFTTTFDVLEWWKLHSLRFHVLSKLARDILSIPITTVTSGYTFSAGGRVLAENRASLSVDTLQMLVCASDWVRVLHGNDNKPKDEERGYTEFVIS